MSNRFQHVDIRVRNLAAAVSFYSALLPALGFADRGGQVFTVFSADGSPPQKPWFGFVEDTDHRPNTNRVAFWAESRDEVDRLGTLVRKAGGRNVSGPRDCPEYGPSYYAVFFEDPSGNCLEVCYTEEP